MNQNIEYKNVIKSTSFSQKEILYNIMRLHNSNNGFDCDITYSSGNFYSKKENEDFFVPEPKIKMDVQPLFDDVIKIEPNGNLPLMDNSINSIVIDLPFVIAPKTAPSLQEDGKNNNKIIKRFSYYYPIQELTESYYHWLKEAYRVLNNDGICVFKTQATTTSAKQLFTPEMSWMMATSIGFYPLDQFFLLAKNRLHSGKIKSQQHARKYTSTIYVFKKNNSKKIHYLNFMTDSDKKEFFENLSNEIG